uniref:Uncharacterized protein n=1 Tax=Oryza punctata TaxID=4537 RepID=A0A1V1H3E5_ORYPU|nr:hypothetical protein [Oryza punctata]
MTDMLTAEGGEVESNFVINQQQTSKRNAVITYIHPYLGYRFQALCRMDRMDGPSSTLESSSASRTPRPPPSLGPPPLPDSSVAVAEDILFRPNTQAFAAPRATVANGIHLASVLRLLLSLGCSREGLCPNSQVATVPRVVAAYRTTFAGSAFSLLRTGR